MAGSKQSSIEAITRCREGYRGQIKAYNEDINALWNDIQLKTQDLSQQRVYYRGLVYPAEGTLVYSKVELKSNTWERLMITKGAIGDPEHRTQWNVGFQQKLVPYIALLREFLLYLMDEEAEIDAKVRELENEMKAFDRVLETQAHAMTFEAIFLFEDRLIFCPIVINNIMAHRGVRRGAG